MIYIYDFHIKYKFKKCQKNKLAVSIQFIFYVLCRLKVHELVTDVSPGYGHVNFNNLLYENSWFINNIDIFVLDFLWM